MKEVFTPYAFAIETIIYTKEIAVYLKAAFQASPIIKKNKVKAIKQIISADSNPK